MERERKRERKREMKYIEKYEKMKKLYIYREKRG